jgi:hypothetical protein
MAFDIDIHRFPFLFRGKQLDIQKVDVFAKVKPEFAKTHNGSTLRLVLDAGVDTPPEEDAETLAEEDTLVEWNGLLRTRQTPAGTFGKWDLRAWRVLGAGTQARIERHALEDIVVVCDYTCI